MDKSDLIYFDDKFGEVVKQISCVDKKLAIVKTEHEVDIGRNKEDIEHLQNKVKTKAPKSWVFGSWIVYTFIIGILATVFVGFVNALHK